MNPRSTKSARYKVLSIILTAGVVLVAGVSLAACGSSSSSSSSSSASTGNTEDVSTQTSGGADPNKVYAPGVPTLTELYKGNESAPPSTGPKAKKGLSVVWASCGQEAPGCAAPAEAFGEAAKILGWQYRIVDGKLNANNGFESAIRTAIASHPDVIVTHGMNCNLVKQPLEEAKAAGILLPEAEEIDCDDPRIGGEKFYGVNMEYLSNSKDTAEFYERWGENQADYIIDATEGKAKVILAAFTGLFGQNQTEAQERELAKCSECEIVAKVPFESSEQAPNGPLFQRFSTTLVKYPEANAAILPFDTAVTYAGLSKAVVDAGRADSMVVVAGEASSDVLPLLVEEKGLNAEPGAHSNSWFAWGLADEINRVENGQPTVPEGVGFRLVDKDHNLPPAGQNYETEIDYKGAYEKLWKGE